MVFAPFAFNAWTLGNPAPNSLFAPRQAVRVVSVEISSGRTNGSIHYTPRIEVLRGAEVVDLRGVTVSFFDNRRASAEAAIEGYSVGQAMTVRLIHDAPYADRTDWFTLIGAILMSFFAMLILIARRSPGLRRQPTPAKNPPLRPNFT